MQLGYFFLELALGDDKAPGLGRLRFGIARVELGALADIAS